MGKSEFQRARAATRRFVTSRKVRDHMFYGPTSDEYWEEPRRIVMLNMEAYGHEGHWEVDRERLLHWLHDRDESGTRTTRYSLAFLTVLLGKLGSGAKVGRSALENAYADASLLEETLDRITYFNINPISNARVEQDSATIAGIGTSEIGILIWNEIQALDADIILISGKAGLIAFNALADLDAPLAFRKMAKSRDGVLIQSIPHPSRPRYDDWLSVIRKIAKSIPPI